MAKARGRRKAASDALTFQSLMARKEWGDIPPVIVLAGDCDFMKDLILKRLGTTIFGDNEPVLERFEGPSNDSQASSLPVARVLDELRTPSLFSPWRIVVVDPAEVFLANHAESLSPFLDSGFGGGYFVAFVQKLDGRRAFSRTVKKTGWIVECRQPYDRPPPWESRTPMWESPLSHWVVARASEKGLELDTRTAFTLHERAGSDLGVLDEELDKLRTYAASRGLDRAREDDVRAVVGESRQSSVFHLVDIFLEGRRADALADAKSLFERGFRGRQRGTRSTDPMSVAQLFISSIVPRLRALRQAHAMRGGPDEWVREGIVQRPFLARFQRQVAATSPDHIARVFERLFEADRSMKSGGRPDRLLELLIVELCGRGASRQ